MMQISALWSGWRTYRDIRVLTHKPRNRREFLIAQRRRLNKWLHSAPGAVPFYANASYQRLSDLPLMNKERLMAHFADLNTAGITTSQGWEAFDDTRMVGPYHVGASTGTSGNRGLYVISEQERFAWLGAVLAKMLPGGFADLIRSPERVAVILPLHTRLYDAADRGTLLRARFFDLTETPEAWTSELEEYDPTLIIAPPRILSWLAQNTDVGPDRACSAAEVLDPVDRDLVESAWGITLGQIYMATEGLLGVSCAHGKLHLCEDSMVFELTDQGNGLHSARITDFRRRTQVMARYNMNDLLRLSKQPCTCGSHTLVVDEVVGRQDDCINIGGKLFTPDILRNAVLDTDRRIQDFRIRQVSAKAIDLHLDRQLSGDLRDRARDNLLSVFLSRDENPRISLRSDGLALDTTRKLRRVEVAFRAQSTGATL
jgi:putative adenylate-forming enzyme